MIEPTPGHVCRRSIILAACALPGLVFAQPKTVVLRCPGPPVAADTRAGFYLDLLDLVMKKGGSTYRIEPNGEFLTGQQVLERLPEERGINLAWGTGSHGWDERLWQVAVPIDKGILGWRLVLIKKRDRARFAAIRTLQDLERLAAGQQRDWSDVAILRANGLKLVDLPSYEGLFPALAADRFQYLPRGIAEIRDEEKRFESLDLIIEPTIALHYRQQSYFYVSRKNPGLHDMIERGMRAAIADGSYEILFDRYNGEAIRRANLDARRVFELKMPD